MRLNLNAYSYMWSTNFKFSFLILLLPLKDTSLYFLLLIEVFCSQPLILIRLITFTKVFLNVCLILAGRTEYNYGLTRKLFDQSVRVKLYDTTTFLLPNKTKAFLTMFLCHFYCSLQLLPAKDQSEISLVTRITKNLSRKVTDRSTKSVIRNDAIQIRKLSWMMGWIHRKCASSQQIKIWLI